ncbi:probable inactive receptor kinase at5g67200 [Phtheirospermum japonicum]|uniref:Probable inactive receptor kinase at5g67200 n=1 Tax=Phtheirospermum japonicum TaxID=374723 RepID=A0A830BQY9_9LAMI|nr:probable inactive receptor kinase at5g67200 [Phtheirospermum japonicum]
MLPKPFFHLLILTLSAAAADDLAVPLTSLPADAVALLSFISKADLDNKLLYATNERFDYCQWQGVKCAQGRVVRYAVPSLGLRGTVASSTLSLLVQLRTLSLRNNSLSGPLPDLSTLVNLKTVSFDRNYFSGTFPLSILSLHRLLLLDLSHNTFTGPLPDNLTVLDRLGYLRLDSNRFSGPIPPLNQTTLEVFNISNNNLTGPIPVTPTLRKFPIFSFLHNPKLCGEVLNKPCRGYPFFNSSGASAAPSPPTPLLQNAQSQQGLTDISHSPRKNHRKHVGLVLGSVTGTLILTAVVLSIVALIRKRREEYEEREEIERKPDIVVTDQTTNNKAPRDENANSENPGAMKLQKTVMKSGNLVFCSGEDGIYTLEQLMRASAELLGRGTIGTTYKAVMANQFIVSVKRLDACKTAITSGDQFEQYMESVGVLRHPNLVPVRAYFQAQQERLIIFDYQPNGSLFNLIHGRKWVPTDFIATHNYGVGFKSKYYLGSRSTRAKPLHWTSCLKIAEDVAQGLAYIHQASKFVHGNLKSSNVLLGPDFEACVTDYCLAALADTSSDDDPDFAGYRAPEIRKSARGATAKSDVYAFGVLLLELLTGKPPSQHPFLAPPDMPDWVRAMRDDDSEDDIRLRMLVEVASICSLTSPEQRPTMWQVLKMITNVKEIMDDSARDVSDGYS